MFTPNYKQQGSIGTRVDGTHVPREKHEVLMYMYARK
jgi:hypothetical protein